MPQYFDEIAFASPEDKKIARVGIAPEVLLNLQCQRVHAAPHDRNPGREPHQHDLHPARRGRNLRDTIVGRRAHRLDARTRASCRLDDYRHEPADPDIARRLAKQPTPPEYMIGVEVVTLRDHPSAPRPQAHGSPPRSAASAPRSTAGAGGEPIRRPPRPARPQKPTSAKCPLTNRWTPTKRPLPESSPCHSSRNGNRRPTPDGYVRGNLRVFLTRE